MYQPALFPATFASPVAAGACTWANAPEEQTAQSEHQQEVPNASRFEAAFFCHRGLTRFAVLLITAGPILEIELYPNPAFVKK